MCPAPGLAGAYVLVGMAAANAATTHAPIMAAVMACELSGDWALALPLLLASGVATGVARSLRSESLYTEELRERGIGWEVTLDGRERVFYRLGGAAEVPGASRGAEAPEEGSAPQAASLPGTPSTYRGRQETRARNVTLPDGLVPPLPQLPATANSRKRVFDRNLLASGGPSVKGDSTVSTGSSAQAR